MVIARNPILGGFYPDPSICRVDDDYYLVNSSFAYFPGVPIFHSKDLANWEQIGNVLDRNSQIPLEDCGHSEGIFAPTIRYFEGVFYLITTNVSGGGNFIVTARDPKGPWSEPYYLGEEAVGIDPSLFFEEDGTCYYVGTRPNSNGVQYDGDWEIWIQELDLKSMRLVGESKKIWKGALNGVIWPEGPHIYKKGDYYYLLIAEGGTGLNHCISVARSKNIKGSYENNPNNPILTHRHMGKSYPIRNVGHGDLVDDKDGNWYVVMLASRTYEGFSNLGRETFLAKVTWEDGWPVVNAGVGQLEEKVLLSFQEERKIPKSSTYHFRDSLNLAFVTLRNLSENTYSLTKRKGFLRLYLLKESLKETKHIAYIGVRQQDYLYQASTLVSFIPQQEREEAGIAIVQSNTYFVTCVIRREEEDMWIQVVYCKDGVDEVLQRAKIYSENVEIKIVNRGQRADFYYKEEREYQLLIGDVDMHYLSTEIAGGFTGTTIGMYTSSNGETSNNYADFEWFQYEKLSG